MSQRLCGVLSIIIHCSPVSYPQTPRQWSEHRRHATPRPPTTDVESSASRIKFHHSPDEILNPTSRTGHEFVNGICGMSNQEVQLIVN